MSAHRHRTGTGSRVRSTAHRRLALDAVSVLCYPSPRRWKKRSIRTRSQLQNGAVYGGLGAAPSTSNLGSSRQRKSQVWPRWVPRGIACRFLVPRIYALSGGISSNEKRGRLHILLLIIRIFQFDGSVNDTFHKARLVLCRTVRYLQDSAGQYRPFRPAPGGTFLQLHAPAEHLLRRSQIQGNLSHLAYHITLLHSIVRRMRCE